MTTEQEIAKLPKKHSEVHVWTKPETQKVLKALKKATYGFEGKPLFEVTKESSKCCDFYVTYTVTGFVKGVGKAELLTAKTTKSDRVYVVRHHKQLFQSN